MRDIVQETFASAGSPEFRRVLVLCVIVAMLDGYDTQVIALVAPILSTAWNVEKSALGPVFAAGLVGLMLGSVVFGDLADRYGRKPVICAACFMFGLFALLTPLAATLHDLAALRFLTGVGLGAAIPNLMTLTAEHAPGNRRALAAGAMFCGFPLGALVGGLAAPMVISNWGWQGLFVWGGVLPLAMVGPLCGLLVESPEWKRRKTGQGPPSGQLRELFASDLAVITPLLWLAFVANLLAMYFLMNWLPILFAAGGANVSQSTMTSVLLNLGGIAGCIGVTPLVDRFGALRVMPVVFAMSAVATLAIGLTTPSSGGMTIAILLAGFGTMGAQMGSNAFAMSVYPTILRATGLGWALSIGRIGSIAGPLLGGVLLAWRFAPSDLFSAVAIVALLPAVVFLIIGRIARRDTDRDQTAVALSTPGAPP
ncbi:MFS transporter [Tsuneonella sp. HG094]